MLPSKMIAMQDCNATATKTNKQTKQNKAKKQNKNKQTITHHCTLLRVRKSFEMAIQRVVQPTLYQKNNF